MDNIDDVKSISTFWG